MKVDRILREKNITHSVKKRKIWKRKETNNEKSNILLNFGYVKLMYMSEKHDNSLLLHVSYIENADSTVIIIQHKLKDTVQNFIFLKQRTYNSRVYKSDDAYPLRSVQYFFTFKKGELEILRFTDYEECKFLKLNNIDLICDLKDILNRISTGNKIKPSFTTFLNIESTLLINWNDKQIAFETWDYPYQENNEIYYILIEKLQLAIFNVEFLEKYKK